MPIETESQPLRRLPTSVVVAAATRAVASSVAAAIATVAVVAVFHDGNCFDLHCGEIKCLVHAFSPPFWSS